MLTTTHEEVVASLRDYMQDEFIQMLNSALEELGEAYSWVRIELEQNSYIIHFRKTTAFYPKGWHELHDDKISHIEIKCHVRIDGALCGPPCTLKFSPTMSFYNLQEIIDEAKKFKPRHAQILTDNKEFSMTGIMNRKIAVPDLKADDYRVLEIARMLANMDVPQTKAQDTAYSVVLDHPMDQDVDMLFEIAINRISKRGDQ